MENTQARRPGWKTIKLSPSRLENDQARPSQSQARQSPLQATVAATVVVVGGDSQIG
jgi:hypothetical protein